MRGYVTLATIVLVLAVLAAACGETEPVVIDEPDETEEPEAPEEPVEEPDVAVPEGPYEHLARAEAGEYAGTSVHLLGQWIEAEGDFFARSLEGFAERTGIDLTYDGITDYETVLSVRVEGGNPPDIAQLAQPGLMREFAQAGHLVDLSTFMNTAQLESDYGEAWTELATVDDGLYGLFYKADTKSIVWYPAAAFEAEGYAVPETWDELWALSEQIRDDGNGAPWCISVEHGDASGWVATDWIEDVLLRTAPPEVYDGWVEGTVPFTSPEVTRAAEIVGDLWFEEGFAYGGATYINATWVGETQDPMFHEDGPRCWMHKQAAWIPSFWPADPDTEEPLFEPGVDVPFFYLPPIDEEYGNPVLGSGDLMLMFEDRDEVRAVMEFLATPEAAEVWIVEGGIASPNSAVPDDWYIAYAQQETARILGEATTLRFDASDMMPAEVGQGRFWEAMVEWIAAEGTNTDEMLESIDAAWPSG